MLGSRNANRRRGTPAGADRATVPAVVIVGRSKQNTRHARHTGPASGRPEYKPCAGHPRLLARKPWMAGTSPAMTWERVRSSNPERLAPLFDDLRNALVDF